MATYTNYLQVRRVDLSGFVAVCREFRGPYEDSPQYVAQVLGYASEKGIAVRADRVLGLYFDRPDANRSDDLRSYQGVLVDDEPEVEEPYFVYRLRGDHLCATIRADQPEQLDAAYGAIFGYASARGINIASEDGIEITRQADQMVLLDIFLETGATPLPSEP